MLVKGVPGTTLFEQQNIAHYRQMHDLCDMLWATMLLVYVQTNVPESRGPFYCAILTTCITHWVFFYKHGLTHIRSEVWGEITFPFQNLNVATAEVGEWISNSMLHCTGYIISYPC